MKMIRFTLKRKYSQQLITNIAKQGTSKQVADALKNIEKRLTDMAILVKNISTNKK